MLYNRVKSHEIRQKQAKAIYLLNQALRKGEIERGSCAVCARNRGRHGEAIQGHHTDYDRPLDVIWLCAKHHKCLHIKLRRLGLQVSDSMQVLEQLKVECCVSKKAESARKDNRQGSLLRLIALHHAPCLSLARGKSKKSVNLIYKTG